MTQVDVELPPGWLPLGPVEGALIAAAAVDPRGRSVATLVVRMQRCLGVSGEADVELLAATLPADDCVVRELRWCGGDAVAMLAACAAPGAAVTAGDLRDALRQTAVYAVDSTGNAIRSSSAGDAKAGCFGSTRTV